jgi:parallel beta-helix repeat protein
MYSVGEPQQGPLARGTDRLKIGLRGTRSGNPGKGGASLLLAFLVLAGCFFTMITIFPVSVRATTWYVGGTGGGNSSTIMEAINNASSGDTVFVYNGTYLEQVTIAKTISLVGEANNVTIIDGGGIGTVVYVTANWVNISGFTVKNSSSIVHSAGIELHGVNNCTIADNNVSSNNQLGIFLNHSNGNRIENNDADDNIGIFGAGIYLSYSNNNTVINNTASGNAYGLYAEYSANNSMTLNNASSNRNEGLSFYSTSNSTIANNSFYSNAYRGIFVLMSEGIIVADNRVISNTIGVYIESSSNCSVVNNSVSNNADTGLFLQASYHNMIHNNTIMNHMRFGIEERSSYDNLILNNSLDFNSVAAIVLESSLRETFAGNNMGGGGIYIGPGSPDVVANWNSHSIDETNLVKGNPVRYWKDAVGGTIPSGSGQVILANCTGITVEDQNISGVNAGIELGFSSAIALLNLNVSGNSAGVIVFRSNGTSIMNVTASYGDIGVYLYYSENATIRNSVTNRDNFGVGISRSAWIFVFNATAFYNPNCGISIGYSDHVTVANSTMIGNGAGFGNVGGGDTVIVNSTMSRNSVGITLMTTQRNRIFHNAFLNNTLEAEDTGGPDWWNDSYPSGGNYWSNYTGSDVFHGPNQNLPGADGIGDTPLLITRGANQDNYPLMSPYPPLPRAPPTPPKTLQAAAGNAQVTLTWAAPDWDGLSPVTNYTVFRGTASGGETPLITLGNVLTYLNTGLTNGQTYYYKVAAINVAGEGAKSNEASARPATIPGQPTGLSGAPADRQVSLSWSAPVSNGGSPITNYAIHRGTTSGGESLLVTVGNVLSHVDPSLTNGVTYYYTVAAINGVGQGPNSTEASATPLAVPTEPLNLQATTGNGQLTLTWSAPLSDGGVPITNYTIYRGLASGGESYLIKIGNVLTYDDIGLINGRTYYYQVSATNGVGEGPRSAEVGGIPGQPPSAPIGLAASPGNRQAILTWSPPADNGGLPITSYSIYRGNFSGGETFLVTIGNVLAYTNTGLNNGQTYFYRVSAWNAMGEGAKSNEASTTPAVPPSEPSDLIANGGIGQVSLQWLPPIDNGGSPVTGYRLYRGTSPGGETLLITLGNVQTYLDGGLNKGTTYYYQVTALNAVGEGRRSVERSATTAVEPTAPRNPRAVAGNGQVRLSWSAPSSDGGAPITNYRIYKGTSPSGEIFFLELGNVLTYTDAGLANGQAYYYLISAVNVIGEGIASGEVSATPTAGPSAPSAPLNLQAFAGNRQVTLTWVAPASDGGAPITSYRIYAGASSSGKSLVAETGNQLSFVDRGLTNGEMRFYAVAAVNAADEGARSNEASATPRTVPAQPADFTAVAGNGQVTLSWTAPVDDGGSDVTGYKVYRGVFSGQLTLLTTLGNVLTYLDTGLTNSQVYYYMASAVSAVGEGQGSNVVSSTPWNRPPTCLIDAPLYRSSLSGTVTVSGTASDQDGTVVRVEVRIDDGTWQVVSGTTSWSYSWDTGGVSDGQHKIYARSFDGDGYSGLAQTTVTVANAPPQGGNAAWMIGLAILILLALVVFYFLKVRPKRREKEEKGKPPAK